jgi:alkaline phosphatase
MALQPGRLCAHRSFYMKMLQHHVAHGTSRRVESPIAEEFACQLQGLNLVITSGARRFVAKKENTQRRAATFDLR